MKKKNKHKIKNKLEAAVINPNGLFRLRIEEFRNKYKRSKLKREGYDGIEDM